MACPFVYMYARMRLRMCEGVTNPVLCPPSPMSAAKYPECISTGGPLQQQNALANMTVCDISRAHAVPSSYFVQSWKWKHRDICGTAGPSGTDQWADRFRSNEVWTFNARRDLRGIMKNRPQAAHAPRIFTKRTASSPGTDLCAPSRIALTTARKLREFLRRR
jgi:hypothetical protein